MRYSPVMPTTTTTPRTGRGRPPSSVDPQKWAALVSEVFKANGLEAETAAHPRGPVRASPQTIRKWQKAQGGVTADMVRDFARAVGYPVARALVEVGWFRPEELGIAGLAPMRLPAAVEQLVDPLAKRINAMLTDTRVPETARDVLRVFVQGAYDAWVNKYRRRPLQER